MDKLKRVAKNTGYLYGRMAITVFISLYITRIILASLGVEDFGIYNVVGGAISMLLFLNVAMTKASQRFMSYTQGEGNSEKQKTIFNVSFVLHILIAIILVLFLEFMGSFLFDGILNIPGNRIETAKFVYHFMVLSAFFTVISVPYDAVINAHENMFFVAILGVIESVLKLIIALIITQTLSDKLYLYGLLMASISFFLLLIKYLYSRYKYEEAIIDIKKYFKKEQFKELSSFAGWSFLGTSTSMISFYGQGIVLNMFFGPIVNAAQGITNQISGQLSSFSHVMLKALNPVIDKSEGSGNRKLMLSVTYIGSKVSFLLLTFVFVPVMVEMKFIFEFWLDEVPKYTIIFCYLYFLRNLIDQIFVTLLSSIKAVGDIKNFEISASILHLSPLLISYYLFTIGLPPYSLYIVFIFYSIAYSIIILIYAKINTKISIIDFLKNVVLKSILTFLIILFFSILPLYFMKEGFPRLFLVILISSITFLLASYFISLNKEERQIIKTIKKSVTNYTRKL